MKARTLGEAVLALHREEQALADDGHDTTTNGASANGDHTDQPAPSLSPMWAVRYFIAHRARGHAPSWAQACNAHRTW